MKSGLDLIRSIDPKYIENIRALFQGSYIRIDIFSRTMQMFVPKRYQTTELDVEHLAGAILDLFEELDTDCDGAITWQDFIGYYSQSTADNVATDAPPSKDRVFENVQSQQSNSSTKTGRVVMEPVVDNAGDIPELVGGRIIGVENLGELYFVLTDRGIYQYDQNFLFPKKIFEPDRSMVKDNKFERDDARSQDKRIQAAMARLRDYGVNYVAYNRPKIQQNEEKTESRTSLQPTTQNCSTVLKCILLRPHPIFVVFLEYPGLFFVNLQQQVSRFFPLESAVSAVLWDSETTSLYIGHVTGKLSLYEVLYKQIRKQEVKHVAEDAFSEQMKVLYQVLQQKGLKKTQISQLTKEDLIKIYPELNECFMATFGDSAGNIVTQIQQRRDKQRKQVEYVLKLKQDDLYITGLSSDIIFDLKQSAIKTCHLDEAEIIKSAPTAYVDVFAQPLNSKTEEQKHSTVELIIDIKFLRQKFVTEGAVKVIQAGRGAWEDPIHNNLFRIVVGSGDGSILVLNDQFREICSFPALHEDGILNLHVLDDNIVSIGYKDVFLINGDAVKTAQQGHVIHQQKNGIEELKALDEDELVKGNLLTATALVRPLPPPRPGSPIIYSFMLGNVIGVIDYQQFLTLFNVKTGAHVTRLVCNFNKLMMQRFGEPIYNNVTNTGYIPVGKTLYFVRAVGNEQILDDDCIWDVIQLQAKEEQQLSDNKNIVSMGSVTQTSINFCVNQALNEVAIVVSDLEIMFFSLITGKPIRKLSLDQIENEEQEIEAENEYKAIQTDDVDQFYIEKNKFKSKSLPRGPPKPLKKQTTLLEQLGQRVLAISCDTKGRVMFVIGPQGTACIYWKTAKLFDINNVGILGNRIENVRESKMVGNPLTDTKTSVMDRNKVKQAKMSSEHDITTYTLNINFDILYKPNTTNYKIVQRERTATVCADKLTKRLYVNDSMDPTRVFCLSTSSGEEFRGSPINTRCIKIFELAHASESGYFLQMREQLFKYYSESPVFTMKQTTLLGHDAVAWFVPQFLQVKGQGYPVVGSALRRIIELQCGRAPEEELKVTCMANSAALGLLAIGCTNGQIFLFDSTTNFLPQGAIAHQFTLRRPAITSLCFADQLPLLFSANTSGDVYLHTVKPLKPGLQLVSVIRHANYVPDQVPLRVDFKLRAEKLNGFMASMLRFATQPNKTYIQYKRKAEELIRWIILTNQPEMRSQTQFIQDASPNVQIEMFLNKQQPTQHSEQEQAEDAVAQQKPQTYCHERTNINAHNLLQGPRQMMNLVDRHRQEHVVEAKVDETADDSAEREALDYTYQIQYLHDFIKQVQPRTLTKSMAQSQLKPQETAEPTTQSAKQLRMKRTASKLTACVTLMGCFDYLSKLFLKEPRQLCAPVEERKKQMDEFQVAASQLQQTTKIPKEMQKINLRRTNMLIRLKEKQIEKLRQQPQNDAQLPETDDVSGQTGFIYRVVTDEAGVKKVPVRLKDQQLMRTVAVPTAISYDNGRLLVGDEYGFVTLYDYAEIIKQTTAQPVQKKFNVKSDRVEGLEAQKLPRIPEYLTDLFAHTTPTILYSFHAHTGQVTVFERLTGTGSVLSFGADRRLFAWDVDSASLLGLVQRVQLLKPSPYLEKYFRQDIRRAKRNQGRQLPPTRTEYPPACAYEWRHKPSYKAEDLKKIDMAMSAGADSVHVKRTLMERRALPTYEEDGAEALLKSTGLTPKRLAERRNSWTVRAILSKATGGRADKSEINEQDLVASFAGGLVGSKSVPRRGKIKEVSWEDEKDLSKIE